MALAADEREAVETALRDVYDPELGIDVLALGLIYGIAEVGDRVVVDMTLTTPGCPVSDGLPEEAREAIAAALEPFGRAAEVNLVWEPRWSVERLTPEAADQLGIPRTQLGVPGTRARR